MEYRSLNRWALAAFAHFVVPCWVSSAVAGDLFVGDPPQRTAIATASDSLDLRGVVVDLASNKPLEGAWVLLSYHESRSDGFSASGDCVKTRGTTTGADGTFRFRVDKREGIGAVTAIRPGYYLYTVKQPTREQWKRRDEQAFSNFTVLLKEQDPVRPEWFSNPDAYCRWARTPEDAAAADKYLEIQIEEYKKYGGGPDRIRALQNFIDRHKSLGAPKK